MSERRLSYGDRRPYLVPATLAELTGPTSGVVELPNRLDWSEQRRYNLDDPAELGLMYERVVRESLQVGDLRRYLDGPTLLRVWSRLVLPRRVRALWEERFPSLRSVA
ncbi:hypothetical protein ACFXJ8_25510 [Nonomuraea sp. NPDC059194]|uniref:hypothetical protein n=1 Tax=Nonomuraea sp. NPDC059194 TaxID=3346764 RepID=UPI0036AB4A28